MKALVLRGGTLRLEVEYPEPTLRAGDALVEVLQAGICGTDHALLQGYAGFSGVLGHEFVGRVVRAETGDWVGQRVVAEINCPCGACSTCQRGLGQHCSQRKVLGIRGRDGVFASRVAVPLANLHRVPDSVTDEQAVFVEPLAAAFEILEQVAVQPGWRALLLGDGRLGQLIAQVLAPRLQLTVCSRTPAKRELLAQRGIRTVDRLEEVGWDLVVECTGDPSMLNAVLDLVRPRGLVVLKSSWPGEAPVAASPLVVKEITLVGSRCGPFAPALRALEQGSVRVDGLVTSTYPLDRGLEALEHSRQRGVLKVLLKP